jgi:membrane-bound lytic murein transglycosylase D
MVPHEATVLMAARAERSVPVAESRAIVSDAVVPTMASNSDRVKVIYQVKNGDTLGSIARVFRTSAASIQSWNRLRGTQIRAGERLTIYTVRANSPPAEA